MKHLYRKPGYVYFRHPKTGKLTPLPPDENSHAFKAAHDVLMAALKAERDSVKKIAAGKMVGAVREPGARVSRRRDHREKAFPPPTLGYFIIEYLRSDYFNDKSSKAYAEGTRYNYRKALDLLRAELGKGNLADLDQRAVKVHSAKVARAHGDSAADDQIAMISNVWQYADKHFPDVFVHKTMNPTFRIERHYEHDGEGHLTWPEEVIEAFDTGCPWHLKFVRMGLHYSGQRGGDVAKMKWTDFDGKRINVVQQKTGKKLWLNCPKPLLDVLLREQKRTNREYIFHHAYDAPFANAQTLSHAIRNRLVELGINAKPKDKVPGVKGYTMHGLRKNAGMELAEAGAEVIEIMNVLGHKTPTMAIYYCNQARQAVLNENAVAKWDAALEKKAANRRNRLRPVHG